MATKKPKRKPRKHTDPDVRTAVFTWALYLRGDVAPIAVGAKRAMLQLAAAATEPGRPASAEPISILRGEWRTFWKAIP